MVKISTLGVLRLRATSAVSRDRSERRSAQDDAFLEVEKHLVGSKNTGRSKKSQALRMTKGRAKLFSAADTS
jgi:hypothetical protein